MPLSITKNPTPFSPSTASAWPGSSERPFIEFAISSRSLRLSPAEERDAVEKLWRGSGHVAILSEFRADRW